MTNAISGWNPTLHSKVGMLNSYELLCSVGFQPEMALVMHLIYGGLKLKKIVYPKRNGVCTYYGAKSTFFNNGPFRSTAIIPDSVSIHR